MSTNNEQTFTTFTPSQAAQYAQDRGTSYAPALYSRILAFHAAQPRTAFLDVGTGPGKVVFDLLPHFSRGLGCDSSAQMVEQARKDAVQLGFGDRTVWAVSGGETCAEKFAGEKVDLITVAMAAHWFDMAKFYTSAAKILKPGGTLAIWTLSSYYAHPSMERWKEVDGVLHELEDGMLGPYALPGNVVSRNAYEGLKMPWDFGETEGFFGKEGFERVDWDRNGVPSGKAGADGTPAPFLSGEKTTVDEFISGSGSASMVIRWRQANPDKAHTELDPIYVTARKLRKVMGDEQELSVGPSTTLLLFRRAA